MKKLTGFFLSVMVLTMTGASAQAGTDYSIRVVNNSSQPTPFEVYQKAPGSLGPSYQNAVAQQQETNIISQAATIQGVSLLYAIDTASTVSLAPGATGTLKSGDGGDTRVISSMTGDCGRVREAGGAYLEIGRPLRAAGGYTINVVNESSTGTCVLTYE